MFPVDGPNGIGLSPDGSTLYWAETHTGRVFRRRIASPGRAGAGGAVRPDASAWPACPGYQLLDSLAVDGDGNVCVATLVNGGVTVISPEGEIIDHVATGDLITTNICFGGPDLPTAFITASATGRLVSTTWPRPGLALAHQA